MSPEEKAKADEIYKAIIGKERNSLVNRYGKDAEKVAKGRAIKQAQKLAEKKMDSSKDKLREMVKSALMGTNEELKGSQKKLDVAEPKGKITAADFAMLRKGKMEEGPEDMYWSEYVKSLVNDIRINGIQDYATFSEDDFVADYEDYIGNKMMSEDYDPDQAQLDDEDEIPMSYDDEGLPLGLGEDLDLGHEDNEPHMLKGDLYRIGKYAMELYQMVDEFEGKGEVDFPHWWQSKIIKAKEMVSSAKHYLDFETKEPQIDAMVGAIDMSGALDNIGVEDEIEENLEETRVNPNTNDRVNYLAHTLEYIWNMGKGNNSIDFKDLAKSTVGDMFGDDEDEIKEGIHDRDITSAPHTNVKGEMKPYNPKDRAASLARLAKFGPKPKDEEVEETLAQRIAKKLKEDVVKGSNIRKDSKGKWRVLSGKTGKMWPQTYDSKADAEDALQAYHATKG